ncbi:MAG: ribbon-helix-helix domain-containing protein [Terriglobia bacterium]|jgi:ribbon-helix-helix protein
MPEAQDTTRLTITWSKETDLTLRSFLGARGLKKGALSKFIEEAVRWRVFDQTTVSARERFADLPANRLQKEIDQAVEAVRTERYRRPARRS